MADLFAGIDGECAVSVTFYLRPQLQWIPSAWKQWGLKTGASFSDFIAQCIGTRTPAFKRDIENWKSMLPRANIDVRFPIPELLAGGNPAQNFSNCSAFQKKNITLKPKREIRVSTCRSSTCYRKIRWLLNTYCSDADVDGIYRMHFMPRKAHARYSDMTESELIYRCLGIILESIASSGGQSDRRKNRNQGHDSTPIEDE